MATVFKEVMYKNDLTKVIKHDSYYKYFDKYGCYRNAENIPDEIPASTYFYSSGLLSFGDYDNSRSIERANVREFLELHGEHLGKWFHHVKGGHNSESIYVDITCDNKEIVKTLQYLVDSCCLNDETVCEVEREIEDKYWESCNKIDFLCMIQEKFEGDNIDCSDDGKLYELYHSLKETANEYFEIQAGGNGYIRLISLVNKLESLPDFITIEKY